MIIKCDRCLSNQDVQVIEIPDNKPEFLCRLCMSKVAAIRYDERLRLGLQPNTPPMGGLKI